MKIIDNTSTSPEDARKKKSKKALTSNGPFPPLPAFLALPRRDVVKKFGIINQYENSMRSKPSAFLEHPCLSERNRYASIQPWAHNTIRLQGLSFPENYINASPVKLEGHQEYYIATQGPGKGDTMLHFWQMAWQENVEVIVMLTQYIESGKIKCGVYIPIQPGEKFLICAESEPAWGQVECLSRRIQDWGEIRELRVVKWSHNRVTGEHYLTHFLFSRWPDHHVPLEKSDQVALIKLIQLSRQKMSHSHNDKVAPRIIHCSAGVGRTGTFIALDLLLQEFKNGKWDRLGILEDPVFNTVRRLREQRMGLVYNIEQYAFIYQTLKEIWESHSAQLWNSTNNLVPLTENAMTTTNERYADFKLKNGLEDLTLSG